MSFCQDLLCPLLYTPAILKDSAHTHLDDAHDNTLVAEETALHVHTRAQTRAADTAQVLDDPIILKPPSYDETEKSIQIPATPTSVPLTHALTRTTDEIALHDD